MSPYDLHEHPTEALDALRWSLEEIESLRLDAARYRRLRILGAAPLGSKHLNDKFVMCFTTLDKFIDDDIRIHPSRGEAK